MDLKTLDDAGKDVRAWCFECARGERVDTLIWKLFSDRQWPMDLDAAAQRFRCRECGSSAHVRLYPATRPYYPPMTPADFAAAIFFGARKAAKAKRRDPIIERAARSLAAPRALAPAPRRSRPAPALVLVWSRPERP